MGENGNTHRANSFLKDHKNGFDDKDLIDKDARLITPAKSDLGKVSRKILHRVNDTLREKTGYYQWKSTGEVLEWFKDSTQKKVAEI